MSAPPVVQFLVGHSAELRHRLLGGGPADLGACITPQSESADRGEVACTPPALSGHIRRATLWVPSDEHEMVRPAAGAESAYVEGVDR